VSAPPSLELRPAGSEDRVFLTRLYATTRDEEMAHAPFDAEQKAVFLLQQFEAQRRHYATQYVDAAHDIIVVDGEPAGRLIVDRREHEILVVDIALLPAYRSCGLGARVLRAIFDAADASGVPVIGRVERFNRALRLWERLGFVVVSDEVTHLRVVRAPAGQAKTAS
jgi:GNAT superfamily N-acetyltransferase